MVPLSGAIRLMINRAVVDLPQPDSPTMPSVSPASTANETPSTARTMAPARPNRPDLMGKCLTRPFTSRSGGPRRPSAAGDGDWAAAAICQALMSMAERSPSVSRLNEIEVRKIIMPGSAHNSGWV